MARIAGVDLPRNKRGVIGLTYIYGIGKSTAEKILSEAGISESTKVNDWTDDNIKTISRIIADEFKTEGQLRSEVQLSIKRPATARPTHANQRPYPQRETQNGR
jgi:small subunit ribosomal protein S13